MILFYSTTFKDHPSCVSFFCILLSTKSIGIARQINALARVMATYWHFNLFSFAGLPLDGMPHKYFNIDFILCVRKYVSTTKVAKCVLPFTEWILPNSISTNRFVCKFLYKSINEQISNFAQTYPTNLKASSNEALLFMRRYRFANCSCFSCCFKDAYPSSNVQ